MTICNGQVPAKSCAALANALTSNRIHVLGGSMPSPAARQFHGISWLVLVVALGLILFSIAQKAYRLTLPTDGWLFATGAVGSTDEDRPTYLRNLLDQPSPLQRSDRLLAVEGRSFEQILAQAYATQ